MNLICEPTERANDNDIRGLPELRAADVKRVFSRA